MNDLVKTHEAHFESLERQTLAATVGMWAFLASEVLFFGGLFVLYGTGRTANTRAFDVAAGENTLFFGSVNTLVLLTSSLFVALAVHATRKSEAKRAGRYLLLSAALGVAFLAIKAWEYGIHFAHGIYPGGIGAYFASPSTLEPRGQAAFYTLYFVTTGLHALHVFVGVVLLVVLGLRAPRRSSSHGYVVEMGGMYWHLVDMIWLFIWPMYYLVRAHGSAP